MNPVSIHRGLRLYKWVSGGYGTGMERKGIAARQLTGQLSGRGPGRLSIFPISVLMPAAISAASICQLYRLPGAGRRQQAPAPVGTIILKYYSIRGASAFVKHVLDALREIRPPHGIEILPHQIEKSPQQIEILPHEIEIFGVPVPPGFRHRFPPACPSRCSPADRQTRSRSQWRSSCPCGKSSRPPGAPQCSTA